MTIGLYLKKDSLLKKLDGALKSYGNSITTFENFTELFFAITKKRKKFDLIIADISFQQSNQCLQSQIFYENNWTPVIFHNDPYPEENERVLYWFKQNVKALDANRLNDPKYEYNVIFMRIHKFLVMEKFLVQTALSPTMSWLLNYFYNNIQKEIDGNEIIQFLLEKSATKIQPQSIYSYISRLKDTLKEKFPQFTIVRPRPKTYMMIQV